MAGFDRRGLRAALQPTQVFDAGRFELDLRRLLASHGLLAISAHLMVPLDAGHHEILQAESGVDQLSIDILNNGRRAIERRAKELA